KKPRTAEEYFGGNHRFLITIRAALETLNLGSDYDVWARVHGGGLAGQADAIRLGIARALCTASPDNRPPLKAEGFLTRDPRVKERKKYGLHKARKAPQYSKR
ncbi:MAG: 30S ribosomal protein S9, partial [Cyanobacteria bacterium J06641_5]